MGARSSEFLVFLFHAVPLRKLALFEKKVSRWCGSMKTIASKADLVLLLLLVWIFIVAVAVCS